MPNNKIILESHWNKVVVHYLNRQWDILVSQHNYGYRHICNISMALAV